MFSDAEIACNFPAAVFLKRYIFSAFPAVTAVHSNEWATVTAQPQAAANAQM